MIRMLYGGRERALCAALRIYSHGIYNVQITRRHLLPSLTQKLAYIVIAIANTIILHEITTACMCSCTMQDLRYSSHIVPEQKHPATAATIIGWVAGTSIRIFGSFRSFCLFFFGKCTAPETLQCFSTFSLRSFARSPIYGRHKSKYAVFE